MALPAIGAIMGMLGRSALTGIGGVGRIASYTTRAGMRGAAIRALGRLGRSRRARRTSPRRPRQPLHQQARSALRRRPLTRRGKSRQAKIRHQLRRYRQARQVYNSLPNNAPRGVFSRARAAVQGARNNLQQSLGGGQGGGGQGGGTDLQQGLQQIGQAAASASRSLLLILPAAYSASRGMEMIGRFYGQYNSGYGASNAMLDASRISRSVQVGADTSASYQKMIQSLNRLEQATVPFQVAMMRVANWALEKLNDISTYILQAFPWLNNKQKPTIAPDHTANALADFANRHLNMHGPTPPPPPQKVPARGTPPKKGGGMWGAGWGSGQ